MPSDVSGESLHTLNNTSAKGFQPNAPLRKAFDTINIHTLITLIRKLIQTNIPGTIMTFIANYIKGRKTYTTYINHISIQRQFKTGVPQGGVLSSRFLTCIPQTYHHPVHWFRSWPMQMTPPSHQYTCTTHSNAVHAHKT